MEQDREEKKIQELLREEMQQILSDPLVKRDKEAFISKHFVPAPVSVWRAPVMVPAACLAAAFALFIVFRAPELPLAPQQAAQETPVAPVAEKLYTADEALIAAKPVVEQTFQEPAVKVKRLGSEVGSTMVYQKNYQDVPVTIVWVFPTAL